MRERGRLVWRTLALSVALVVGAIVLWVSCTGATPEGVDTEAQAAARDDALADAATDRSAAPDGIEGVWTVDSTIGSFDDACLRDVCSSNFIGFRIEEQLVGVGAKTVVGRTDAVTGSLTIVNDVITATTIDVDMRQLQTDDRGRDAAMKGATGGLETQKFPDASFVLSAPIDLGTEPAAGAVVDVDATGDLTLHGVTRTVTFALRAERRDGLIVVFGTLEDVALAGFDIPRPVAPVVLGIDDVAAVELQLFFSR